MRQASATLILGAMLAAAPTPAVPLEPVAAMVDAFRTHAVVAVTAGHGEARGYAFAQLLIHDPRLIAAINDIVIEEGSARYQDVADRFVRGDNVPMESLRHVWRDTTQPGLGYDRQWEEFFTAMRGVNASLPAARKVRVLLGDPPIEWEHVKTPAEHRRWIEMRDTFPADLIQREVIAKGRHALLTYGSMHFQRKNLDRELRIGRAGGNHRQPAGEQVGREGVHDLHGRRLGAAARRGVLAVAEPRDRSRHGARRRRFHRPTTRPRRWAGFRSRTASPISPRRFRTSSGRRSAPRISSTPILYTGKGPSPRVDLDPARCADKTEFEEHLRRMTVSGIPAVEAERLKKLCGL